MSDHQQIDLFQADMSFVQIFRTVVEDGTLARIKPNTFGVLLVIKMAADWATGKSRISLAALKRKTGLSIPTIRDAIALLKKEKLLEVYQTGNVRKQNTYKVIDKLLVTVRETGEEAGMLAFPYVARDMDMIKRDVRTTLKRGVPPAGSPVVFLQIKNLNIHTGTGSNIVVDLSAEQEDIRKQLESMPRETAEPLMRMLKDQLQIDLNKTDENLSVSFQTEPDSDDE